MKHKPTKLYCFNLVVEGSGQFPFDMLRYDHCWPINEGQDSPELAKDWGAERRQVALRMASPNDHGPTIGRWDSFGWRVIYCEAVHDRDYAEPLFGAKPEGRYML